MTRLFPIRALLVAAAAVLTFSATTPCIEAKALPSSIIGAAPTQPHNSVTRFKLDLPTTEPTPNPTATPMTISQAVSTVTIWAPEYTIYPNEFNSTGGDLLGDNPSQDGDKGSKWEWPSWVEPATWAILCYDVFAFLALWCIWAIGWIGHGFEPTARLLGPRSQPFRQPDYLQSPQYRQAVLDSEMRRMGII